MEGMQDLKALQGFLDETNESLQGIETAFIALEHDPGNIELINTIFRPVHSMKGNSGFFGLTHINKFAHRLEDLLDFIRNGKLAATPEIIDILLAGIDYLQQMLHRVEENPETVPALSAEEETFLREKVEACKPAAVVGSVRSVIELEELLKEAAEAGIDIQHNSLLAAALDQIAKYNLEIRLLLDKAAKGGRGEEPYPAGLTYWYADCNRSELVRPLTVGANCLAARQPLDQQGLAALKGTLPRLGELLQHHAAADKIIDEIAAMANFLDDELMAANDDFCETTTGHIADLLALFEVREPAAGSSRLGEILLAQEAVSPEQLSAALQKQARLGELLKADGAITEEALQRALAVQNDQLLDQHLGKKKQDKSKTIRIDQSKLDSFADSVGELFINVDSFNFLTKKLEAARVDSETMAKFVNNITALDDLLGKLQDNVMSVRKVPVNTLFQRFPRVIRQLSASLEKKIDFRLVGEDTVIDKDLLETIENPLVHILRNSVDHGVETPAARSAKNKPEQGVLELTASVDEYNVYLVIRDDGGGIDPRQMAEIAVQKGFMSQEEVARLTDRELLNLIFKPGFSSAARVSDVSGRGVGMDAVMAGLNQCNGTIVVDSVPDTGTTVTITIPLTRTLVTKDALIIDSSGQLFAIPSDDITTTVYPDDSLVKLLHGESGISYNNRVLRLVNANNFFFNTPAEIPQKGSEEVIVICEKHGLALVVDKMFNHQQIVVKVFNRGYRQFHDIPGIYGFTILGNEDIVLIMDVEKVARELATSEVMAPMLQ